MGDAKGSLQVGKFNFKKWFKSGLDQGNPSSTPPPPTSVDDEESDEQEDEEAGHYGLEDAQKPKYKAQGPRTQSGLKRDKERVVDTSLGRNSTSKLCAGCKLDISQGTCREFMGTFFHPQCFSCHTCGRQITEHESILSESGHPHHKSCYDGSRHPTCDVCRQLLPLNRFGPIEYRSHPFWFQKYCQRHDFDYTPRCRGCDRLQPWDVTYVSLGSCRKLCSECKESAVMVTSECQPLYLVVREFLESIRIKLPRPVSVRIVDEEALHLAKMANGIFPVHQTLGCRDRRGYEIFILVLYGFPRLHLGAWIAKELMSEWLLAKGYNQLPPELEDSICWLVANWWLESELKSAVSSSKKGREWEFEKKLGEYFMYKISNSFRAARCGAFRATKISVVKYGLRSTIEHINLTGFLPP